MIFLAHCGTSLALYPQCASVTACACWRWLVTPNGMATGTSHHQSSQGGDRGACPRGPPPTHMTFRITPRPHHAPIPGMLRHGHRLTRSFVRDGQRISYIHVYARPLGPGSEPDLEFITAQECGFEGIACVDDAARAAILALQVHEETGSAVALRLARDWLRFVIYMQEPDGRFTNFIADDAGTKNRHGQTSYAGGRWWTARALSALAMAWRVTGDEDYLRHFLHGRLAPTRDLKVKALQALALMELYQCRPDDRLRERICALCEAIVASGPGYFRDRSGQDEVAVGGYHQQQAVARAAHLFARLDYVKACADTVRTLVEPVEADGFYYMYPRQRDMQCAYSVSTLVLGLEELYGVSGQACYHDLALQCAAWLDGKNPAGGAVYDPHTGRCAEGIIAGTVSPHCGAESAIEAGFITLARQRLLGEPRTHEAG